LRRLRTARCKSITGTSTNGSRSIRSVGRGKGSGSFQGWRGHRLTVIRDQILAVRSDAQSASLHHAGSVGRILQDVGLARLLGGIRSRAMGRQGGEHHDTAGARLHRRGFGAVVLLAAYVTELAQAMRERAAQMSRRNYPRASVFDRRVGERDPAGQVRLRLDIGVAVVLMPRERLGVFGLLVDRLVPVEPDVGTNQIAA